MSTPAAPSVHRGTVLAAFARARFGQRFASRAALLAWQERALARFLAGPARAAPFYRALDARTLRELPVVDKATMLAQFAAFNNAGVELSRALAVAERAERERDFRPTLPGALTVGLSSGTSGQRGVFLVSARERSVWAGTILARLLSPATLRQVCMPWRRPLRVAFFLRADSNLYGSVRGRRVRFQFFDLLLPLPVQLAALATQQPDVLIAPASVLGVLARAHTAGTLHIAPQQVISVAEVLEADDADAVATAWGVRTAQVYQCTEGLLGQTCAHGNLHLNEEFVHFEPEWLDATHTRFVPRITDFTRHTQVFARYRLDDVLRVEADPCPCGRATLRIAAIEGRCDDVLWLPTRGGGALQPVFPDVVRRAMALGLPQCLDYRVQQHGAVWAVQLHPHTDGEGARATVQHTLAQLASTADLIAPTLAFAPWTADDPLRKRRRIRCVDKPDAATRAAAVPVVPPAP